MNKNLNSPHKLTEFAPLSPEESQPVVASLFSKIFSFTKSSSPSDTAATTPTNPPDEDSLADSDSWQQSKNAEKSPSQDTVSLLSFSVDEGRSLPNVLKRISNIVASKNTNLRSYKNSELRSYWMPDSVSKQCYECGERFTTFRRRHHCRVCGQIFCSKCCCDEIPGKIMGCTGDLRVCTYCCKVVLSYLQSSDMRSDLSADLKALQEDLEEKYGNSSRPALQKSNITQNPDNERRRKPSVGYMEEKYALGRSSHNYLTSHERTLALQNSASLRMLYEEVFRSNTAILLQTHRIRLNRYNHCFVATELVDWLIAHNKSATRIQATAMGQALFEAGFIEPVLMDDCFSDSPALFKPAKLSRVHSKDILVENQTPCDAQEPAWVRSIPSNDTNTDSENESKELPQTSQGRIPSSSSSFYLDLNVEASTVTLKRPTSDDMLSVAADGSDGIFEQKEVNFQMLDNNSKIPEDLLNNTLLVQDVKEKEGWHETANLKNAYSESSVYTSLTSVYKQHEEYLLRQLLNKEGLSQNWSEVILQIAHQAVDRVRPDLHHDTDDMDIRQYVQIKKSPGGSKNDCEIVSGVVCSKNVAHKGMNAMIANPKILLLRCGLTYQRVEGRLLSLEPVLMQESEYLGHTVARINALGPDIVLVHKSVSRLAQDKLRECNVTLVLNVKLSILERLARCTGANIVDTIDAHMSARYKLGICKKFYLRHFPSEKSGLKTLMYFEGCANPHLGATVLLRGGSQSELKKVKKVASMMIFAAYSCRLEKSFLMDEFARPPSPKNNSFLDESLRNTSPSKIQKSISDQSDNEIIQNIPEKSKTSLEETISVISVDEQSFDRQLPAPKSTPVKSDTSNKVKDSENINKNENFEQVSALLMNATSSYDTLKLFKPKSKSSIDESTNSEKTSLSEANVSGEHDSTLDLFSKASTSDEKSRTPSKDKPSVEEKRVHGQSVSDRSDPLHQYLNEDGDEEVFDLASPSGQCLSVADLPLLNKFKKALEGTILSVSPYLKFSIPYLETEPGRNCTLRNFFPKELYYSTYFFDKIDGAKLTDVTSHEHSKLNVKMKPAHPFVQTKLTMRADSRDVQNLLAHFRACGGRLDKIDPTVLEKKPIAVQSDTTEQQLQQQIVWPDCLDPASHQRLSVLFCSFLHNANTNNAPAFCVNPWVVNMDLYGRNDIALGRFLERYCLTTEYKCPAQNCRAQIAQHVRRFVHDGGCVHISLCAMNTDPFGQDQEKSNQIFMWSKCTKCKSVSPVVPISDDTWSLSFAKYLELRFHASVYNRRGTDTCQHSLHHDHEQFFSKRNMLAVMRYYKISQWEISLPPPLINIIYDAKLHANVVEEMKGLAMKGDEVFSCVREKINGLQLDSESLVALKAQLSKDQQYFKNKIEELQLKFTSPTLESKKTEGKSSEKHVQNLMHRIEDNIVIVKRVIADAVATWNSKINEVTSKKKDERLIRKPTERTLTATNSNSGGTLENDGYNTEDNASESQVEDLSPMSADYNAIEAIAAIQEAQLVDAVESSDNEVPDLHLHTNPDEIVVLQGSPKTRHRTYSDAMSVVSEEAPDKKKKKKTILSQLLPSTSSANTVPSPLGPLEHHLLPLGSVVPIVVYESEPSSIIAYALDSIEYKHALQAQIRDSKPLELVPSPLNKRKLQDNKENVSDIAQPGESKKPSMLSFLRGTNPNPNILASPVETDKPFPITETTQTSSSMTAEKDDEPKNKQPQPIFVEVQFADSTTDFFCRIYFAIQFAALRERVLSCGEDGYTRSLSRSVQWAARGGKSGSTFCKTRDDRFILKEMKPIDLQIFLDFAPNYFAYMEKCQQTNQPTLLGKIVGVYRVSFRNTQSNAGIQMNFLVMENLFYNRIITDKFDLKGSVRNRLVNPEEVDQEGELVLLDENLLNMSCDSPLYIRPHAKAVLNKAIEEDTKFLADNCVMDYSLLVGLEPNSDELVLGIIDYIRTFTWDKKIETLLKRKILTNSQGKLPTIVSPIEYRVRFIAAMHKYFLPVPDRWFGLNRGVTAT